MKKIILAAFLFTTLLGSLKSYSQTDQYVGQITAVAFNFAPVGWLKCEGQLLPISEYEVLFALIGTTYGGDGQSTFALPDFRSRALIGSGQGNGMTNRVLGSPVGSETTTMTTSNMPPHSHGILASNVAGTSNIPTGNVLANSGTLDKEYVSAGSANITMQPTGVSQGGAAPIDNIQPYVGMYYIIAYQGIFPSQN